MSADNIQLFVTAFVAIILSISPPILKSIIMTAAKDIVSSQDKNADKIVNRIDHLELRVNNIELGHAKGVQNIVEKVDSVQATIDTTIKGE